nr:RsmG family class I SAM-dependent methyltransferase [Sporomusa ovata]EQB28213.1 ribosomal RNA small subunit methyltransferase G [Sporomusa ovata DSM 2662]
MDFCAKLAAMAVKYNIKLSDKQLEELTCYYEMLRDRDYIRNAEITVGTMIDCLSCYDAMMFPVGCRVIDVAAGPGFPGIPLKILRPDSKLCLLDASDYRLEFWREVVDQLKLSDVTLVHAPVEEVILMPEHREQYQVAVSRGLSFSLSKLVELCLQLVKPDGYYIQFEVERRKRSA